MTSAVTEIYTALRTLGIDEDRALAAAKAVLPSDALATLATKADIADLKVELHKTINDALIKMTGLFALIVTIVVGLTTYLKP